MDQSQQPVSPNKSEKLSSLVNEIVELESKLQNPEIVKNPEEYKRVSILYSKLVAKQRILQTLQSLTEQFSENQVIIAEETDPEMIELAQSENQALNEKIGILEYSLAEIETPEDPLDKGNAIIEIRAGTGGEEAALFAQELFRAYSKYAEKLSLKVEIASISYATAGGFKEAVFFAEGFEAYKHFKFENGVHRVQRVPATEAAGRIHTSTISVVVLPETEEIEVEIKPEEIRVDVYRSSGPGGQSVNTTDSAVRIVHIPTGIVVTCQDQKSQLKNKAKALKILQAKLYDLAQREAEEKLGKIRQGAIQSGDRSAKIRTYNFPQSRVTDHRIKVSWHNISEIMEGDFSQIEADLHKYSQAEEQSEA